MRPLIPDFWDDTPYAKVADHGSPHVSRHRIWFCRIVCTIVQRKWFCQQRCTVASLSIDPRDGPAQDGY
jgi:hypothetical protein